MCIENVLWTPIEHIICNIATSSNNTILASSPISVNYPLYIHYHCGAGVAANCSFVQSHLVRACLSNEHTDTKRQCYTFNVAPSLGVHSGLCRIWLIMQYVFTDPTGDLRSHNSAKVGEPKFVKFSLTRRRQHRAKCRYVKLRSISHDTCRNIHSNVRPGFGLFPTDLSLLKRDLTLHTTAQKYKPIDTIYWKIDQGCLPVGIPCFW